MSLAFTYAVLTGVSMAVYIVLARLASPGIQPVLGTTIVVGVAFLMVILIEAAVSVLGYGALPPPPSWGGMLNAGAGVRGATAWPRGGGSGSPPRCPPR
jgi:ABC-type dipeptide/oligopeptide/nickel transport system permease subunit